MLNVVRRWTLEIGRWTLGRWTLDIGHWALDIERWTCHWTLEDVGHGTR